MGEGLARNDVNKLALFGTTLHELHYAITLREEGVVLAATNILARVKTRSPLTNDDVTGQHALTTVALHAQSFRF